MATTFLAIHHYCAAHWVADPNIKEDKRLIGKEKLTTQQLAMLAENLKNNSDSRAAIPIVGLLIGTAGLVAAVAGVVIGGIALLFLAMPALCNLGDSREYLSQAFEVFYTGVKLTVLYPLMMIYGQTIGWVTHTCCFTSGEEFGIDLSI